MLFAAIPSRWLDALGAVMGEWEAQRGWPEHLSTAGFLDDTKAKGCEINVVEVHGATVVLFTRRGWRYGRDSVEIGFDRHVGSAPRPAMPTPRVSGLFRCLRLADGPPSSADAQELLPLQQRALLQARAHGTPRALRRGRARRVSVSSGHSDAGGRVEAGSVREAWVTYIAT